VWLVVLEVLCTEFADISVGTEPSNFVEVAACNFSAPFSGHDDDDATPDRPPYRNMTCIDEPLMAAVMTGPVTVSVEAGTSAFQL
jgi:hypothetical protein